MRKRCKRCRGVATAEYFCKTKTQPDGLSVICKNCIKELTSSDPERAERSRRLLVNYGVTEEEYNRMLEAQRLGCAICGGCGSRDLAVDHDHQTGEVRGLLCETCNLGLGAFRDSIILFKHAIKYLEEHESYTKTLDN